MLSLKLQIIYVPLQMRNKVYFICKINSKYIFFLICFLQERIKVLHYWKKVLNVLGWRLKEVRNQRAVIGQAMNNHRWHYIPTLYYILKNCSYWLSHSRDTTSTWADVWTATSCLVNSHMMTCQWICFFNIAHLPGHQVVIGCTYMFPKFARCKMDHTSWSTHIVSRENIKDSYAQSQAYGVTCNKLHCCMARKIQKLEIEMVTIHVLHQGICSPCMANDACMAQVHQTCEMTTPQYSSTLYQYWSP